MLDPDDQVTSTLAAWREAAKASPVAIAPVALPRLVAAIEAALELADEWETDGSGIEFLWASRALRETLGRSLSCKEESDG